MNTNNLAAGWIRVENGQDNPVDLIFEPWGVGPQVPIPPGEAFDIFLTPLEHPDTGAEVPHIKFKQDLIILYADLYRAAIYYKGEPVENIFSDLDPVPVPPFPPHGAWQSQQEP
jgi:hypothetical protein